MTQVIVVEDFLRRAVKYDVTHIEDDCPISEMQRRDRVLFNDNGCHAEQFDLLKSLLDLLDDNRRDRRCRKPIRSGTRGGRARDLGLPKH